MFGNREGFNFREQTRRTPTIDSRASQPVWNHDEVIRDNIIGGNGDAQVWGWFDMKDQRHWPAQMQQSPAGSSQELNLEKLRLRFENNVYFAAPAQGWFTWGTAWGRHQTYDSLEAFRDALAIDTGSRVLNLTFADPLALDFRLAPGTLAEINASYPQGPVPDVNLGALPVTR
jgi:hypothetical protein